MPIGINKVSRNSQIGSNTPDSVVTRTSDDSTFTSITKAKGARIESDEVWSAIGAVLSQNVSGVTTAYVYRVSDATLLGDADVYGLSSGDSFTIDLSPSIKPYDGTTATQYNFVLDNGGSGYTQGSNNSVGTFPIKSSDNNLRIVSGAINEQSTENSVCNINDIGNTGF